MVQGRSYLQLFLNKACTRELEKDENGDYIYDLQNVSINAVTPLRLNFWCKNVGSHSAYEVSLQVTSSDIEVTAPTKIDRVLSSQILSVPVDINIQPSLKKDYNITMRFEYDSI